jgi:serine/threonine-protein kinase
LAKYRQGRYGSALDIMRGEAATVMGPAPRLVEAMAEYRDGQKEEARLTLAAAISSFDWSAAQVGSLDHWIWHVLRREAENLVFPNTSAFQAGKYQPQDNVERLAFVGVCRFKNMHRAMARLYAEAFAADPHLANDPHVRHRYNAACAAALAGGSPDAGELSEAERARWRAQARTWLQAEVTTLGQKLHRDPAAHRLVHATLIHWRADPDLAGVREPSALDRLGADERKEWRALWQDVEVLLQRTQKSSSMTRTMAH